MSEALKILNNIRTLRAQARECTLETLEEMLEKLEVVVNERREEDNAAAAEIEEVQWIDPQGDGGLVLAPLTRDLVLPFYRQTLQTRTA